jgi:PAS domain S-box-containing protein
MTEQDQRRLGEILDSIADPVVAFDHEWRYTYVSRRAATVLGKTPEELIGRSMWEVFPADADTGFQEACRRAWRDGAPVTVERYSHVLDCWVENYISPFESGASTQWRDITARKGAEAALRESEAQFRTMANAIPQLCWMASADGWIFWYNERWYEYTGTTPEQMAGWGWQSVHDPNELPRVLAKWKASIESGEPFDMVFPLRGADGVFRPFLTRITPVRDSSGKVVRWFGTNTDISEQRKVQEELIEALQRLDAHMDNSPLAIIEFDREFRVTRWSDEAERLFGWTAGEIIHSGMFSFPWVHPDDADDVRRISEDMVAGRRPRNVHVNRNLRKDGAVLECEWYNSAIYDQRGSLTSILSQVLDLTERKRTEERLRQAQKTESIGLLAGGVAHDFNNLLVGVIGNASLAAESLPEDSPIQDFLTRIIQSGEQAAHLTRQLLGYAGKGRFVLEPVDLSAVVREVTDLVRSTAPKKISIRIDLDLDLPAIEADRGQIHQVLLNLVFNATEAIGDNAGVVSVRTAKKPEGRDPELPEGDCVCLEVQDTGCGMSAETRARIFDPFFTTKVRGRGLGLAAVAGIVRAHKGVVRVRSTPGQGTTFDLYFPALAEAAKAAAAKPSVPRKLALGGAVLVVDDEEFVRTVTVRGLERAGCVVRSAASGAEAIELVAAAPSAFAAVVLDLSMPGMSGQEVLPKLLAINPALDVLVVSGYAEAEARKPFAGMRIAGFLQKPFTVRQVVEALSRAGAARL